MTTPRDLEAADALREAIAALIRALDLLDPP